MSAETESLAEISPPIDRASVYFVLGAVSELIRNVKEGNDQRSLTDLRVYLSAMTLPRGTTVEQYLMDMGMPDSVNLLKQERTQAGFLLEGFTTGIRNKQGIYWYDNEDPLLRSTMLSNAKLDSDSQCIVTYRFDRYNVQWVLPQPEVYWQCDDPDKLVHVALLTLEEILHMNQIRGHKIELQSFGNTYDLSDERNRELSHFVTRMMEIDVANILTAAMPEMIEENWQWYADRKGYRPYEDHYPLSIDFGFLLGHMIAEAMGQGKEFLAGAMTSLPEFLSKNPNAREAFFSNSYVLRHIETYLGWIYEPESETVLTPEQMNMVLIHEFSPEGITLQFLINCLCMKEKHGKNWLELLDKGVVEEEDSDTKHATNILNMVVKFLNTNPKWGDNLRRKRSILPGVALHKKFKSPEHLLETISHSYK